MEKGKVTQPASGPEGQDGWPLDRPGEATDRTRERREPTRQGANDETTNSNTEYAVVAGRFVFRENS